MLVGIPISYPVRVGLFRLFRYVLWVNGKPNDGCDGLTLRYRGNWLLNPEKPGITSSIREKDLTLWASDIVYPENKTLWEAKKAIEILHSSK